MSDFQCYTCAARGEEVLGESGHLQGQGGCQGTWIVSQSVVIPIPNVKGNSPIAAVKFFFTTSWNILFRKPFQGSMPGYSDINSWIKVNIERRIISGERNGSHVQGSHSELIVHHCGCCRRPMAEEL